jgi:hypothetical protein
VRVAPRAGVRFLARLALVRLVAAGEHDAAQDVVREFDAAHVEAFLDAQQAPVDELGQRIRRGTAAASAFFTRSSARLSR